MERISLEEVIEATGGSLICSKLTDLKEIGITSVSSNSKIISEGALFVPVIGEKFDAHEFIGMAFEAGAVASFTSKDVNEEQIPEGRFCIKVDDTLKAVQKLAGWYRRKFSLPVIGITGSVGKTTTKEMLAAALSGGLNVLKTEGNQNSQLGVAMMMFSLDSEYDIAVIEMGISEHGEMVKLADIAFPEAAVVTNIGVSHIGQLGSKENIRSEKLDIVTKFPENGGLLMLCGNDELLKDIGNSENVVLSQKADEMVSKSHIVMYGSINECEYRAYNIINKDDGTEFDIDMKKTGTIHVRLGVMGIHNVHNAAAALAAAEYYNVDSEKAVQKLAEYRPIAMRGQIISCNGYTIIDDTYNSSPDSMKSGLEVLWDKKCDGRRYAVLADVLELGTSSEQLHREVGEFIAKKCNEGRVTDELITVGHEAGYIAEEVNGTDGITVNAFNDRESALVYLKEKLSFGDLVIVKGSRGMHMDKIVDGLKL